MLILDGSFDHTAYMLLYMASQISPKSVHVLRSPEHFISLHDEEGEREKTN